VTKDFAFPSGRTRPAAEIVATLFGLLIALTSIPLALLGQRHSAIASAKAWTVDAPPCPRVSRAAYRAFGTPASNVIDYGGARFARGYGYIGCSEITQDLVLGLGRTPVCQFNNPTVLEVTTARGDFIFMTRSKAATIVLTQGKPRCVLGARLEANWLRR
jgi:hypothetical protein